jgi:peptide/nickel transport system substrate-binding protein
MTVAIAARHEGHASGDSAGEFTTSTRASTSWLAVSWPFAARDPRKITFSDWSATVPIFPKHLLDGDQRHIEERWTLDTPPDDMAGLGPFVIQAHLPGRKTVLGYNPHYWKVDADGNRLPYLDRIVIEYTQDRSVHLLRFKAGELDLLDQLLRPEDLRGLADHPGIEQRDLGPSSNLAFFWFNLGGGEKAPDGQSYVEAHKHEWFSNRDFRTAVSAAVSRRSIVRNVYMGKATEAFSFIPVSNRRWYLPQLAAADSDPGKARSLLEKAGFGWNTEGSLVDSEGRLVEFRILAPSNDIMSKTVAIVQQDLESLGMTVKVQQEEFRAAISRIMKSRDYDAALMNLDFPFEPTDISNVLLSSGGLHFWNPAQASPASEWEKRIDELVREQGRTLDPDARFELVREIQEILAEQRPFIPLVNRNVLAAWRNGLENVRPANSFPFAMWNSWELHWAAN